MGPAWQENLRLSAQEKKSLKRKRDDPDTVCEKKKDLNRVEAQLQDYIALQQVMLQLITDNKKPGNHVTDPWGILSKLKRVLAAGGSWDSPAVEEAQALLASMVENSVISINETRLLQNTGFLSEELRQKILRNCVLMRLKLDKLAKPDEDGRVAL